MRAPITDKHLLEMMWERFPEIMQRGTEQKQPVAQTHCSEKRKPGGCQLHNLHCGWPKCNKPQQQEQPEQAQEADGFLKILRANPTVSDETIGAFLRGHAEHLTGEKFYTKAQPPRKPWVGLTLNEIQEMKDEGVFLANCEAITEVIEAKLKEKNT
jgi:hypothetical protein